jgi:hypothetical protein
MNLGGIAGVRVRDGVKVRVTVLVLVYDGVHVSVGNAVSEAVSAISGVRVGVRETIILCMLLPKMRVDTVAVAQHRING